MPKKKNMLPAPRNYCFACGKANPHGMHLRFTFDKARRQISSSFALGKRYSGPPGSCHGGIIATILDEAMAKLNGPNQVTAVTAHLAVEYLKPVPLHQPLRAEAHETRSHGRRRFRQAAILNSQGLVLAQGKGIFITLDPKKMRGGSV